MAEPASTETFGFQTEAKQLLQLMIHSLYSNREIFLRELISNASDAIDRLRFKSISEPDLVKGAGEFAVRVTFDKDAGTLTVFDNGVGMTREEVIDHLGTIAKSGTAEFLNQLTGDQQKDATLIGQFGVGFYSAFIVADEVEVITRSVGTEEGTHWVSKGEDEFSVASVDASPGTLVILHLKDDAEEFLDDFRLRNIIRTYSDHIGVPVEMVRQATPDLGEEADAQAVDEEGDNADAAVEEEIFEAVNSAKALWTRSRSEINDDEYKEFYKHVSHDFSDPVTWSHNRVEGRLEYTSLLYLPQKAPFDLWNREAPRGLKLYVQRVFIMDEAEQFLPLYLRFIKGVVDSNDLPLNVSREILQQDERVVSIRNALTKRALSMLQGLANKAAEKAVDDKSDDVSPESGGDEKSQAGETGGDYQSFINEFGEVLKEGAGEDFANREAICKLLRFSSTIDADEEKHVALDGYIERMIEGQEKIYYIVADSHENAKNSPHLEVFKDRGIEVLLMSDRIDEWLMSSLNEYGEKQFADVMRGDLELPGTETDEQESEDDALTERIKGVLEDKVAAVRRSRRLTDSPACLVLGEFDMGAQMRRIMEASGQSLPETKPAFEYNADHPLVKRLDGEADEDRFSDLVMILFDQASLAGGAPPKDAAAYVTRINSLLLALLEE